MLWRPPIVIVEIRDIWGVRHAGQYRPQGAAVTGRGQSAMPHRGGIAWPVHLNRTMRRTRGTDFVDHRRIAADDIDTDKDVNVSGEVLREDAFDRLPQG